MPPSSGAAPHVHPRKSPASGHQQSYWVTGSPDRGGDSRPLEGRRDTLAATWGRDVPCWPWCPLPGPSLSVLLTPHRLPIGPFASIPFRG